MFQGYVRGGWDASLFKISVPVPGPVSTFASPSPASRDPTVILRPVPASPLKKNPILLVIFLTRPNLLFDLRAIGKISRNIFLYQIVKDIAQCIMKPDF